MSLSRRLSPASMILSLAILAACVPDDPAETARLQQAEDRAQAAIIPDAKLRAAMPMFLRWGLPGGVHGLSGIDVSEVASVTLSYDPNMTNQAAVKAAFSAHCARIGRGPATVLSSHTVTMARDTSGKRRKLPGLTLECGAPA